MAEINRHDAKISGWISTAALLLWVDAIATVLINFAPILDMAHSRLTGEMGQASALTAITVALATLALIGFCFAVALPLYAWWQLRRSEVSPYVAYNTRFAGWGTAVGLISIISPDYFGPGYYVMLFCVSKAALDLRKYGNLRRKIAKKRTVWRGGNAVAKARH